MGTALSFVTASDYKILKKAEEELTKEITGICFKHLFINCLTLEICFSFRFSGFRKSLTNYLSVGF